MILALPAKASTRLGGMRPGRRAWVGGLALLGTLGGLPAALDWLAAPQRFPISEVQVSGELRHVDRAALRTAVAEAVEGGFFRMDVERVRAAVQALPWVEQARVRRVWPDALVVQVREQVPLARWDDTTLINVRGEPFDAAGQMPAGLPQLRGPAERVGQVAAVYMQVAARLRDLGLHVTALHLDERRALSLELDGGIEVMLGRHEWESRLQRLKDTWPGVLGPRREAIARIDLRYGNGLAVAWTATPPRATN